LERFALPVAEIGVGETEFEPVLRVGCVAVLFARADAYEANAVVNACSRKGVSDEQDHAVDTGSQLPVEKEKSAQCQYKSITRVLFKEGNGGTG
jgi:hypothetical protein